MGDYVKHLLDGLSFASTISALTWLPPTLAAIAALLSIVWTSFRIIEMYTGKTISELRRKK